MLAGALPPDRIDGDGGWPAALLAAAAIGAWLGLLTVAGGDPARRQRDHRRAGLHHRRRGARALLPQSAYETGTLNLPDVARLPEIVIPGIADIRARRKFSGHDPLTWAWIMVPLTAWFLRLARRAEAAGGRRGTAGSALGLKPLTLRDIDGLCGRDVGLAAPISRSAWLASSTGHHGRARLHRARSLYFGRNHPGRPRSALHSAFRRLPDRMQGRGVPAELVQMLPYAMVIVVLTMMAT